MSLRKIIAGGVLVAGIAGGGGAYYVERVNQFPPGIFDAENPLPPLPADPGSHESPATNICPAEIAGAAPCTIETALASLAINQTDNRIADYASFNAAKPFVAQSFVAKEDARFEDTTSDGCDVKAVSRAILSTYVLGRKEGGSTIPRQLANIIYDLRNVSDETLKADPQVDFMFKFFSHGATSGPKYDHGKAVATQVYECKLARGLVRDKGKDWIVENYIQDVYFGRGATGLPDALKVFFGVDDIATITEQQAMVLAGLLTLPSSMDVNFDKPTALAAQATAQPYIDRLSAAHKQTANDKHQATASQVSSGEIIDALTAALKLPAISDTDKRALTSSLQYYNETSRMTSAYHSVIDARVNHGQLSTDEAAKFKAQQINLIPYTPTSHNGSNLYTNADKLSARFFVDYALNQTATLLKMTPSEVAHGGYTITTTLNPVIQAALSKTLQSDPNTVSSTSLESAGVILAKDGAIVAMGNSLPYATSQVNIAAGVGGTGRSSGSSLKGFAEAVALTKGWTLDKQLTVPSTLTIPDGLGKGKPWVVSGGDECRNLPKPATAPCAMTLDQAVAVSSNTGTAQIIKEFGIEPLATALNSLGVQYPSPHYPSAILGITTTPLDLATGYNSLIANNGAAVGRYVVAKITDRSGNIINSYTPPARTQIFTPAVAAAVTTSLNNVINFGTAKNAFKLPFGPHSAAGKTGTDAISAESTRNSDLWFTGTMCNAAKGPLTSSFWYGDPRGKNPINRALTSNDAAKLWGRVMLAANTGTPSAQGACDLISD